MVIISYVGVLSEDRVSGEDFHQALEELLSNANECKNEATILWKKYTQICKSLKGLHDDLNINGEYLERQKAEHEEKVDNMNKDKKEAEIMKWSYTITSAGMTILAPATLGLTSIGASVFEKLANEKAEEAKKCRTLRNESRDIVKQLNGIRDSVNDVIAQTNIIIKIIDYFQEVWGQRVTEIQNLVEDFEEKKDMGGYYSRLTGHLVIHKWTEVHGKYTSYSNIVLPLLNNTTVNRRIASDI